jgi:large subunit ribosomal protein L6
MSRIGKKPIEIPKDISVVIENQKISVENKKGKLEKSFLNLIDVKFEENKISVTRFDENKKSKAYHGLFRALIQNMVSGITTQFSKTLVAEGIGYKFQLEKKKLIVNVGYTHPIEFLIPEEIEIKLESNTRITIIGIEKEKVGLLASKIRDTRPPEPYKGKGIMYLGEKIIRKAGKTGK